MSCRCRHCNAIALSKLRSTDLFRAEFLGRGRKPAPSIMRLTFQRRHPTSNLELRNFAMLLLYFSFKKYIENICEGLCSKKF